MHRNQRRRDYTRGPVTVPVVREAMPFATADTWVSRDRDGKPVVKKVVDMDDGHIGRWIQYFRKKYRENGFVGSAAGLDAFIKSQIVTAPAIYAEAQKRGLIPADEGASQIAEALAAENARLKAQLAAARAKAKTAPPPLETRQGTLDADTPLCGERMITLSDDEPE